MGNDASMSVYKFFFSRIYRHVGEADNDKTELVCATCFRDEWHPFFVNRCDSTDVAWKFGHSWGWASHCHMSSTHKVPPCLTWKGEGTRNPKVLKYWQSAWSYYNCPTSHLPAYKQWLSILAVQCLHPSLWTEAFFFSALLHLSIPTELSFQWSWTHRPKHYIRL